MPFGTSASCPPRRTGTQSWLHLFLRRQLQVPDEEEAIAAVAAAQVGVPAAVAAQVGALAAVAAAGAGAAALAAAVAQAVRGKNMQKLFILIAALVVLLVCVQCDKQELEPVPVNNNHVKNELPAGKGSLKVLAIGNSFTDDPMAYLDAIVRASGIDRSNLCIYSAVKSSASLEYWALTLQKGEEVTITRRTGSLEMPVKQAPLKDLLAQDWDVVTIQQVSTQAQDEGKLQPGLSYLVYHIRENCPNKNVVIAWQQIWSYWNGSLDLSINDWSRITEVVKLTFDYGVDMVIPTGTAIQNARGTALNSAHGFTRDGRHLGYGVGRYVAACTWFESLVAPVYGISVVGNSATHDITEAEITNSTYETIAVTDLNRTLCQQCAAAAISNPYILVY